MNREMALDARTVKTLSGAFRHPALGVLAEWVSLEWLASLANPEARASSPLPGARAFDEPSDLVADIVKNGLREPLIVSVGTADSKARLETGSRRASALIKEGFLFAPAVCSVSEVCGVSSANGEHPGMSVILWPSLSTSSSLGIYAERRLMRPSETIPSCPCLSDEPSGQSNQSAQKKQKKKPAAKKPAAKTPSPESAASSERSDEASQ